MIDYKHLIIKNNPNHRTSYYQSSEKAHEYEILFHSLKQQVFLYVWGFFLKPHIHISSFHKNASVQILLKQFKNKTGLPGW